MKQTEEMKRTLEQQIEDKNKAKFEKSEKEKQLKSDLENNLLKYEDEKKNIESIKREKKLNYRYELERQKEEKIKMNKPSMDNIEKRFNKELINNLSHS